MAPHLQTGIYVIQKGDERIAEYEEEEEYERKEEAKEEEVERRNTQKKGRSRMRITTAHHRRCCVNILREDIIRRITIITNDIGSDLMCADE